MDKKVRINISRQQEPVSESSPGYSSRSRSRSPYKTTPAISRSPLAERGSRIILSPTSSGYRDRSVERTSEKYHKSTLYQKENTSLQDLPLSNTSFNNKIKLPQFQEEQDGRGRTRDRDELETAKKRGADIAANNEERRQSVESISNPDMISLMGFTGFGSTKGKHVNPAKSGAVKQDTRTDYRQYMNRNKGFNRPLSPGR